MEHSMGMGLGLGVLTGVAVGLLFVVVLFKMKVLDMTFDERQKRARGQAFAWGFATLVICVAVYGLSDAILGHWIDVLAACILCVCIAVTVFAIVCIRKDAYLSLKERPRRIMLLFAVLAAVNLALGAIYIRNGTLVENGMLTSRACNPITGIMLLVVLAVYAAKYLRDRKETEE
ncbi:hypothetical protein OBV_29860 [Oscillibacter valericigenes Sjm18-20]|nr:hypothetical protein OBV_29860 [Oscillibacter valericigenes Sjm18-20]